MEIKTRPYIAVNGKQCIEVDFTVPYPDGLPPYRVRKKSPWPTTHASVKWAEKLFLQMYQVGRPKSRREKRRAKELEKQAPPPTLTLSKFADKWMQQYVVAEGLSKGTAAVRERFLRLYLLPLFGQRALDTFTLSDFQLLKAKVRLTRKGTRRAAEEINSIVFVLYQMLRHAVDWELLGRLPPKPKRLLVERKDVVPYAAYEYERLVKVAKASSSRDYVMVLLAGDAGLRAGEVLGLRWVDIDFVGSELHIRQQETRKEVKGPKSKKPRHLSMTPRLKEALQLHRHLCERVLVGAKGKPLCQVSLRNYLLRLLRLAQLVEKGIHGLRHCFASRCIAANVSLKDLQVMLGHASLLTTERYVHLLKSHTKGAIQQLEAWRVGDGSEIEAK